MENEVTKVEATETTKVTETTPQEKEKVKSSEVLRELSKKYGVNLFEPDGIKAFEDMVAKKEVEADTWKSKHNTLEATYNSTSKQIEDYKVQIEALGMGFKRENLDEVMALAKVNTKEGQSIVEGLKVVKSKYGNVFGSGNIGTQKRDLGGEQPDQPRNEVEKYMAQSPAVQAWKRQQEKMKK